MTAVTIGNASRVCYEWPGFRLYCDLVTGAAITEYPDGHTSGCPPIPEDEFHAQMLGITDGEHRLEHELVHHMLSIALGAGDVAKGCPIIWRDAHGVHQVQPESSHLEWQYTAFQYYVHDRTCDFGALAEMEKANVDVGLLKRRMLWLLDAPRFTNRVSVI